MVDLFGELTDERRSGRAKGGKEDGKGESETRGNFFVGKTKSFQQEVSKDNAIISKEETYLKEPVYEKHHSKGKRARGR